MNETTMTQWTEPVQGIQAQQPLYADNCFVGLLLIGFFVIAMVLSDRKNYLSNLLGRFFLARKNTGEGVKTVGGFYMKMGMFGNAFMTSALFMTVYVTRLVGMPVQYGLLLAFFVGVSLVYLIKQGVYRAVNWVFFDKAHITAWQRSYADWVLLSGLLMYLICVMVIFFDLCSRGMAILLVIYLVISEICLFFSAFRIFLVKKYGGLHLFIYLCTLEIIPLLLAGKLLQIFV
jgi:hypothetical protein